MKFLLRNNIELYSKPGKNTVPMVEVSLSCETRMLADEGRISHASATEEISSSGGSQTPGCEVWHFPSKICCTVIHR